MPQSDAKPDGALGADNVRQAGSHLRLVAAQRGVAAPKDSPALLMAPHERIHPSAHTVAEDRRYLLALGVLRALTRQGAGRRRRDCRRGYHDSG